MASIELTLTNQSTDIGDENYSKLFDITANGLEIYPKQDEISLPWDASLSIEGSNVVMDGYISPGGPALGSCVVKIPLDKVMSVLGITVQTNDEKEEEVRQLFSEYNWL